MRAAAITLAGLALATSTLEPHGHRDHQRVIGHGQIRFDGLGPEKWAARYRREHKAKKILARQVRTQQRMLRTLQKSRRTLQSAALGPVEAIRSVFGGYADQALRVAQCESGLSTTAQNGQYLGLFQMGAAERARFGHGTSAIEQVRAAYAYFIASGRSWAPWSCQP